MSDLKHITDDTFEEEVLQAEGPVLIDFTATWCGPCKMLNPIISELAEEWEGKIKVRKLDVDENNQTPQELGVMGVPTLMLFENGEVAERITGFQPKKQLEKRFSPYLKN